MVRYGGARRSEVVVNQNLGRGSSPVESTEEHFRGFFGFFCAWGVVSKKKKKSFYIMTRDPDLTRLGSV